MKRPCVRVDSYPRIRGESYNCCPFTVINTGILLIAKFQVAIMVMNRSGNISISGFQCEKIEKTRIQSFASEICSRAREVDNHLSGTGFQKMSSDREYLMIILLN